LIVTDKLALCASCPLVPVTVTVNVPPAALLDAVRVSFEEVVDDVGLNAAVTPLGNPLAEKFTLPANPFAGTTLIVELPLAPEAMLKLEGDAVNAKFCAAVTARVTVAV